MLEAPAGVPWTAATAEDLAALGSTTPWEGRCYDGPTVTGKTVELRGGARSYPGHGVGAPIWN